MPRTSLDAADAVELAELLQFVSHWLAADPTSSALPFSSHRDTSCWSGLRSCPAGAPAWDHGASFACGITPSCRPACSRR